MDGPEQCAFGVQAHPALLIHPEACLGTPRALVTLRPGDKVPLVERERVRRAFDGPPTFFHEVHLFKADFDPVFASDVFKPEVCDTEPAHDIVAMWQLPFQSFGSVT